MHQSITEKNVYNRFEPMQFPISGFVLLLFRMGRILSQGMRHLVQQESSQLSSFYELKKASMGTSIFLWQATTGGDQPSCIFLVCLDLVN